MNTATHTTLPQYALRPGAPSPIVLTDRELREEAEAVAQRIARSDLPLRDVRIVQELAARLGRLA